MNISTHLGSQRKGNLPKFHKVKVARRLVSSSDSHINICHMLHWIAFLVCPSMARSAHDPFFAGSAAAKRFASNDTWPFIVFILDGWWIGWLLAGLRVGWVSDGWRVGLGWPLGGWRVGSGWPWGSWRVGLRWPWGGWRVGLSLGSWRHGRPLGSWRVSWPLSAWGVGLEWCLQLCIKHSIIKWPNFGNAKSLAESTVVDLL